MSDLISRQAFLDFIESVPFLLEHQNLKGIAIDWIKQQPTAYDTDEVVEQLEEFKRENNQEENSGFIDVTIDIVKGGGIDGEKEKQ